MLQLLTNFQLNLDNRAVIITVPFEAHRADLRALKNKGALNHQEQPNTAQTGSEQSREHINKKGYV